MTIIRIYPVEDKRCYTQICAANVAKNNTHHVRLLIYLLQELHFTGCKQEVDTGSTHSNKSGRNNRLLSSCRHRSRLLRKNKDGETTSNTENRFLSGFSEDEGGGQKIRDMKEEKKRRSSHETGEGQGVIGFR